MNHARLGVQIENGVLTRTVRASRHQVRKGGGGWAFASAFWDSHVREIHRVDLYECEQGIFYTATREEFTCYAWRAVLDPTGRAGEQIILPLARWQIVRAPQGDGLSLAEAAGDNPRAQMADQLSLAGMPHTNVIFYKRGSGPRPRLPKRRLW